MLVLFAVKLFSIGQLLLLPPKVLYQSFRLQFFCQDPYNFYDYLRSLWSWQLQQLKQQLQKLFYYFLDDLQVCLLLMMKQYFPNCLYQSKLISFLLQFLILKFILLSLLFFFFSLGFSCQSRFLCIFCFLFLALSFLL